MPLDRVLTKGAKKLRLVILDAPAARIPSPPRW
jgi:hypothetical protein